MPAIYVISSEAYSGKSALCAALGIELKDRGFNVGYMKPVGSIPVKIEKIKVDRDAYFICETLGLDPGSRDLTLFFLNGDTIPRYMRKVPANNVQKVKRSFGRLAKNRDLMIVEGAHNFMQGELLGLSPREVAGAIDARLVLLDTFNELLTVDRVLGAKEYFGEAFGGAIVNWVPGRKLPFARNLLKRYMEEKGIPLFGAIPTDPLLRSVSIDDLASNLNGEILCCTDRRDELVENMMVGAMGQEKALRLFRKRANKVVITGGDRADIQLAALETPTKCLVLTGNYRPSNMVLGQAEEMGVPIIMVSFDTATAVEKVETVIGHARANTLDKVAKMRELIRQDLDINAMLRLVGLPRRRRSTK